MTKVTETECQIKPCARLVRCCAIVQNTQPGTEKADVSEKRTPINRTPIYRKPIDRKPINIKPINRTPINRRPINRKPIDRKPTNIKPINRTPINRRPINRRPINRKPINKKPINRTPINRKPNPYQKFTPNKPIESRKRINSLSKSLLKVPGWYYNKTNTKDLNLKNSNSVLDRVQVKVPSPSSGFKPIVSVGLALGSARVEEIKEKVFGKEGETEDISDCADVAFESSRDILFASCKG